MLNRSVKVNLEPFCAVHLTGETSSFVLLLGKTLTVFYLRSALGPSLWLEQGNPRLVALSNNESAVERSQRINVGV